MNKLLALFFGSATLTLALAASPVFAQTVPDQPPVEPIAPPRIAAVNAPTESAEAVYLADAAAIRRGDRSQILVLGTAHLRFLPDDFDRSRFSPLLDRLAAWAPERIAIERLSGPQCDYLRAYDFLYEGTADTYCFDAEPARAALGLTAPQAAAEIWNTLTNPKTERAAVERRRLAALFLATGDPASALVQWLRLPGDEQKADESLTDALVESLVAQSKKKSEDTIIAAALAARLGHERVFPVDDHSFAPHATIDEEVYAQELPQIWDNEWGKRRIPFLNGWNDYFVGNASADVLAWYRSFNSPEAARLAVGNDFGAAVGAKSPANTGRQYHAYWETRNLRMAANIREVIDDQSRVLAIVGASHKPYYERYLGVTSDLEIVDIQEILE